MSGGRDIHRYVCEFLLLKNRDYVCPLAFSVGEHRGCCVHVILLLGNMRRKAVCSLLPLIGEYMEENVHEFLLFWNIGR